MYTDNANLRKLQLLSYELAGYTGLLGEHGIVVLEGYMSKLNDIIDSSKDKLVLYEASRLLRGLQTMHELANELSIPDESV